MPTMKELKCRLEQQKHKNFELHAQNLALNMNYKPNAYEVLFQNMGMIDLSQGHRIKHIKTQTKSCYKEIVFKLSDNISAVNFKKSIDHIKEKLFISNLQIESEDGNMIFKILKDDMPTIEFQLYKSCSNLLPMGVDFENELIDVNLTTDPSILIAGVPGCGKSTLLNTMIAHILHNSIGDLYLIDLKAGIEFGVYERCKQVVSYSEDIDRSTIVISKFKKEMNRRFKLLKDAGVKKYEEYVVEHSDLKRYFLIIDEFTDLMPTKKLKADDYDVCTELINIGRKARATGGHLILSTQRPSKECLPPALKAVCSCVIGFRTANMVNSKIVIDEGGLEDLENRYFITINKGKKIYGRTMFLKDEILSGVIEKNIDKNKKIEIIDCEEEPDWV